MVTSPTSWDHKPEAHLRKYPGSQEWWWLRLGMPQAYHTHRSLREEAGSRAFGVAVPHDLAAVEPVKEAED